jgi:2'-5' RNA ligase
MAKSVIASLPEARAALEAARSSGVAAELEGPPDAAAIYGVLWFAELNRALLQEFPGQPFTLTLDCGDRADLAHAALVEGIKRIRFSGHPDAARALDDIAKQLGAEISAAPRETGLLYVIAEPDISAADLDWIQSVRRQHDPQFDWIQPHFTLLFGEMGSQESVLTARVREVAGQVPTFAFDLRCVTVFSDQVPHHYLFLTPDLGSRELISLHEALRVSAASGPPFIPHLTIGRLPDAAKAGALAEQLNRVKRVVRGRVSALSVIAVKDKHAQNLFKIPLAGI